MRETTPLKVLHCEDCGSDARLIRHELERAGYRVELALVDRESDFREALTDRPDVILSDYTIPEFGALRALEIVKETGLDIPFIVVSGTIGEDRAVEAMKAGITDYLLKDRLGRLGQSVGQAVESVRLRAEEVRARQELLERTKLAHLNADIVLALAGEEAEQETVHHCSALLVQHLDVALARIWMVAEGGEHLELEASAGLSTHPVGAHRRIRMGEQEVGRIAQDRHSYLTNSLQHDPWLSDPAWARREGMVSFAGYPLLFADHLFGVLEMFARRPLAQFVQESLASVVGTIGMGIERKRRQAALLRANQRFELATQAAHCITYEAHTIGGRICRVESGQAPEFRILTEEKWIAGIHQEDRDRYRAVLDRALGDAGESRFEIEYRRLDPDGFAVDVSDHAQILRDESGRALRMVGCTFDVTARRFAERKSQVAEIVPRIFAESDDLPAALPRMLSSLVLQLQWDLCEYWELDEATGSPVRACGIRRDSGGARPADPGSAMAGSAGHLLTREVVRSREANVRLLTGGSPVDDLAAAALDAGFRCIEGLPVFCGAELIGVLTFMGSGPRRRGDLSLIMKRFIADQIGQFLQRWRAESRAKAAEEGMWRAQRIEAVGSLAGGVAHDFNNLLSVIIGYGELLLEDFSPGHPARDSILQMKQAADRGAALTRQLLAFSRRQVVSPVVLEVDQVVLEAEKMLRRLIGEDIALEIDLEGPACRIRADPAQIEQVLMNLAVNARDAMPGGGVLFMRSERLELEEPRLGSHGTIPAGHYVLLTVRDTGSGMDRAVLEHLFEPFFTTKEVGKGTGLGLATVHGIIRQGGGHVSVESTPGNGSTFLIFLPRVEEEATTSYRKNEPVPRGVETLLLVEDEAAVREITRRILTGLGYNVLVASNGPEAIGLVEKYQGPLHLLVTDVVMPGMGGKDLALRLIELRRDLKVLFVSGYTDDSVFRQGVYHEKVNFLQKPHSPRVLAAKLRSILDQPASPAAAAG